MAKAKDLLRAAFMFRKGAKYLPIVKEITQGEINPKATYIQEFSRTTFALAVPDVVFITNANEVCFLYKVD